MFVSVRFPSRNSATSSCSAPTSKVTKRSVVALAATCLPACLAAHCRTCVQHSLFQHCENITMQYNWKESWTHRSSAEVKEAGSYSKVWRAEWQTGDVIVQGFWTPLCACVKLHAFSPVIHINPDSPFCTHTVLSRMFLLVHFFVKDKQEKSIF